MLRRLIITVACSAVGIAAADLPADERDAIQQVLFSMESLRIGSGFEHPGKGN